jgi:hypothetical protein
MIRIDELNADIREAARDYLSETGLRGLEAENEIAILCIVVERIVKERTLLREDSHAAAFMREFFGLVERGAHPRDLASAYLELLNGTGAAA